MQNYKSHKTTRLDRLSQIHFIIQIKVLGCRNPKTKESTQIISQTKGALIILQTDVNQNE